LKKMHDISIARAIASVLAFMIIPVIIRMLFIR